MAKLREYSAEEDWLQYCERLEFYFVANGVEDAAKKKATLLAACGASTYKLMCDLVSPAKPKDKTFEELRDVVQNHLKPKPSVIVQRYKFNTRKQHDGESVAEFVASLHHIAQDCNFGAGLANMLRDRLVCGVVNERIQRRLLAEEVLTLDSAFKMAQALETADRNAAEMQTTKVGGDNSSSNMADENVNKVRGKEKSDSKSIECWFCEKRGHKEANCRFKEKLEQRMRKKKKSKESGESDSDSSVHYDNVNYTYQEDSSELSEDEQEAQAMSPLAIF